MYLVLKSEKLENKALGCVLENLLAVLKAPATFALLGLVPISFNSIKFKPKESVVGVRTRLEGTLADEFFECLR
jgi:hypothetical protein